MFFEKLSNKDVIRVSSGAIALQAMANLKSIKAGKRPAGVSAVLALQILATSF